MSNLEMFLAFSDKLKSNIMELTYLNKVDKINDCMLYVEDLDTWLQYCDFFKQIPLVSKAQYECLMSLFFCTQGLYKEAMVSLRQFLEHMLFAVVLSTNDYNYRMWRVGNYDVSWSKVIDAQDGIFGKSFIKVYGKGINEDRSIELINIAKNVYRECSEFVHGNYSKIVNLADDVEYNECLFTKYIECFWNIKYIISMALFIRFRDIFDDKEILEKLESIVTNNLGEMVEVQYLYRGE